MIGFLLSRQKPPEPRRVTADVVMRLDHVYEVDPAKISSERESSGCHA